MKNFNMMTICSINLEFFFLSNRILCKQQTPYDILIYKQHWNESKHATTHFSQPKMLLGFYNRFCLEKNPTLVSPDATWSFCFETSDLSLIE